MKKVFKVLGYVLLGLVVMALGLAAYIQLVPQPTYEFPVPDQKIVPDSARVAEGRRIAMTICAHCHRSEDGKLAGHLFMNDPDFARIYSGNITRDATTGTGAYTDGELVRLLRTGVKRDGHFAGPWMVFPLLSDEDLASIISFLRSDAPEVQPVAQQHPPAEGNFPFKMVSKLIFKPRQYDYQSIETPTPTDRIAYGRYLATTRWMCARCHSASFETNDDFVPEKSAGYFGGGNTVWNGDNNKVLSANITPDRETGIGSWTEAQFGEAVRFGKRPDGRGLRHQMPPFAAMTEDEVSAIWAYLQTIPSIHNPVDRRFGQ